MPGEYIYRHGEIATSMYFIEKGQVIQTIKNKKGHIYEIIKGEN